MPGRRARGNLGGDCTHLLHTSTRNRRGAAGRARRPAVLTLPAHGDIFATSAYTSSAAAATTSATAANSLRSP